MIDTGFDEDRARYHDKVALPELEAYLKLFGREVKRLKLGGHHPDLKARRTGTVKWGFIDLKTRESGPNIAIKHEQYEWQKRDYGHGLVHVWKHGGFWRCATHVWLDDNCLDEEPRMPTGRGSNTAFKLYDPNAPIWPSMEEIKQKFVAAYWANPGDETWLAAANATKALNGGK